MADALTVNTDAEGKGSRMRICTTRLNLRAGTGLSAAFGAHVRVFACRRAAMNPETTRGLRTGCDATLQSVHPGRSACVSLHVYRRYLIPFLHQSELTI